MKHCKPILLGILFGSIAALALTTQASAQKLREEFHQTYPLSANGSISLKNISGAVHISTWAENSIKVDALKTARSDQRLKEARIVVENSPDRISIRTQYPNRDWDDDDDGNSIASVEYNLTIPAGASIDKISLVSGDLDINGVGGDVRASSVSGNVNAQRLGGRADISSVSGDVKVTFQRPATHANLHSVSGNVIAVLPANASADVSANTVSGDISNEFGLNVEHGEWVGQHLTGRIGTGENSLELHTVSGDIRVQKTSM